MSELVDALQAPAYDHIGLSDLGITSEWLSSELPLQIAKEKTKYSPEARQIGACRVEAFERHFGDLAFVRKVVEEHYRSFWTDDYPTVAGTVKLPGGAEITFGSHAQQPFMIPWKVEVSGASVVTYSARVGRAIAAIAPDGFGEKGRLSGESIRPWLIREVWYEVIHERETAAK